MTSRYNFLQVLLLAYLQVVAVHCSPTVAPVPVEVENYTLRPGASPIEIEALNFIKSVNKECSKAYNNLAVTSWNYETNITDETEAAKAKAEADNYKFEADIQKQVEKKFPNWEDFEDDELKRMFANFAIQGPGNMSTDHIEKMTDILTKMETAYSTVMICDYHDKTKCNLRLDRDIDRKLDNSKDWDELAYYWSEWHNAMGKSVPPTMYQEFINYQNEMARANDFTDMSEMWVTQYNDYSDEWTTETFKREIRALEKEIRPFYNKLHAYLRMKLRQKPEYKDRISATGYLPAHILGNMWGQDWAALDDATKPFHEPQVATLHVTSALKKANFTVEKLFREADQFFADLGLLRVPQSFWKYSRLQRPKDGRDVVCHPSAWDFSNGTDVRITMCSEVTFDDLLTAQHEMGHIQYYLQYHDQPHVFQDGANPAFHEAIGDTLALTIMTPTHLQCKLHLDLGLEKLCSPSNANEKDVPNAEINFLYSTALSKIPFIPFSYALESWRWRAFNSSIHADDYNKEWWKMRTRLQGIVPPTDRNSSDLFDPASKFHIVANEPYISYFLSYILQFQFYEAMCKAAGQYSEDTDLTKPLHRCDISGSKAAGKLLGNMMKLGCSTDWRTALEVITGSRNMSAKPMLDYFKPLFTYIDKELEKNHERACYAEYCEEN
ncbi:unnamed protein product [Orchesella dallaii]|uniref:Angiotensin-converting enzyme n=1 Tax=Orchesella dallaii TaxID=48710 RepID=A0ABP1RDN8_9HEXA